jgi:hypothetical protein
MSGQAAGPGLGSGLIAAGPGLGSGLIAAGICGFDGGRGG